MAFPVNASIGTDTETTDDTSQIVTLPATINAGDMILVILTVDNTGALTWPGGWTAVTNYNAASSGARHEAQYKFADGSEGGTTITVTSASSEKSSARIHIITGADTVTPPEAATFQNVSNIAPDPPALSPSWGARDTLWIAGWTADGGSGTVSGTPSGYSGFAQTSEGTVGGTRTASGWRQANTATEDPGAVTGTSTTARAFTIAIKPVGFPDAGVAAGTGTAQSVFANVAPNAEVATGTGQALDPVVSFDALTYAQPPTITGTGTANNARPHVKVNAGLASGTGTANDATGTTLAAVTRTGGTSSIFASATTSPQSVAFTLPAGTNYLVGMVSAFSSVDVTAMTWKPDSGNAGADQAMTLIATSGSGFTGSGTNHIYGLANPTATVTGSVVEHSLSGAVKRVMGVHALGGVNSIGPPATATASDDLSVVVDSTAKGLVLDVLRGTNSTGTYTANTGQTERWDTGTSGGTNNLRGTGSEKVGNYPTVTMGWATPATSVTLLAVSFDASITVDAGLAAGTGQAHDATVSTAGAGTNVDAELASGTGSALDPAPHVKPNTSAATGTGSAANASASVAVNAGLASGTGIASAVSPAVAVNAEGAAGTGTAYDATVSTALSVSAGIATGTGDALAASASIAPNAETASGAAGAAYDATVSTAASVNAFAEAATGTGAAGATSALIIVNAGLATGTGTASDATVTAENEVAAEAASGTGAAYNASVLIAPRAGAAASTGAALDPTVVAETFTPTRVVGFGLDAYILGFGQHDRTDFHYGVQPDTAITYGSEVLDVVLARLFETVDSVTDPNTFRLYAYISDYVPSGDTFSIDAYIFTGHEISVDAVIHTIQKTSFGIAAVIT